MNKKAILLILLLAAMFLILMGCAQTEETKVLEDNEMKTVVIDFCDCKYAQDLYEETIKAMDFPEWCSENLSAIWDMLKGSEETIVYFKGIEKLDKDLQEEALEIFEIFVKAEERANKIHPICD